MGFVGRGARLFGRSLFAQRGLHSLTQFEEPSGSKSCLGLRYSGSMNRFVDLRRIRDDAAAKFDEVRDALGYVEGRE